MSALTSIIRSFTAARFRKLDEARKNPQQFQHAIFRSLINAGRETEFGRKYNFQNISSIEKFQQQIPLHEYDDLKPFIDRMRQGEAASVVE